MRHLTVAVLFVCSWAEGGSAMGDCGESSMIIELSVVHSGELLAKGRIHEECRMSVSLEQCDKAIGITPLQRTDGEFSLQLFEVDRPGSPHESARSVGIIETTGGAAATDAYECTGRLNVTARRIDGGEPGGR